MKVPVVPPVVVEKKKDKKSEAKAAQKEAREAAEAKARQQKEDADQRLREAEGARAAQNELAARLLDTGLKGADLRAHLQGLAETEQRPAGSALARQVLTRLADPASLPYIWATDAEYGSALKLLLAGKVSDQLDTLYALQAHCHGLKFPKIDVKGKPSALIELLYSYFSHSGIVEDEAYLQWADDDSETGERGAGKMTAVVQTTNFFLALRTVPDRGEEDEDDDVDEERETWKDKKEAAPVPGPTR